LQTNSYFLGRFLEPCPHRLSLPRTKLEATLKTPDYLLLKAHSQIIVILNGVNAEGISQRDRFATFGRIHDNHTLNLQSLRVMDASPAAHEVMPSAKTAGSA